MAQIKNEAAYRAALKRVEQLEEIVDDENQLMDDNAHELDMLIDLIEEDFHNIAFWMQICRFYFLCTTKMEESAILLSIKNKNIVMVIGDQWIIFYPKRLKKWKLYFV